MSAKPAVSLRKLVDEVRVSSVLNRDVKQFGKKHLLDGNPETCWNSDAVPDGGDSAGASHQWIRLDFSDLVVVEKLSVQFQGGFACRCIDVVDPTDGAVVQTFHPEDNNKAQLFVFDQKFSGYAMKLEFRDLTDFYGRITIYDLDVFGVE
jgi:hypothetical protein